MKSGDVLMGTIIGRLSIQEKRQVARSHHLSDRVTLVFIRKMKLLVPFDQWISGHNYFRTESKQKLERSRGCVRQKNRWWIGIKSSRITVESSKYEQWIFRGLRSTHTSWIWTLSGHWLDDSRSHEVQTTRDNCEWCLGVPDLGLADQQDLRIK